MKRIALALALCVVCGPGCRTRAAGDAEENITGAEVKS